jgi:hypothetical protein
MLEVVVLKYLKLTPHLGWEAPAALAPVDEEALEIESRVLALRPQVVDPVDDAWKLSCRHHGPNICGQRGEPFDRPFVQDSVVGVNGTAHGLPIGNRAGRERKPWAHFSGPWVLFSGRKNGFACRQHGPPQRVNGQSSARKSSHWNLYCSISLSV